jgi:uncharacterized membrane-anchored protein
MNKRFGFFIFAVVAQILILAAVPAKKIYTRQTGTLVVLKVAPYDPYTILSGYYASVRYSISTPPAWFQFSNGSDIYVVLQKGSQDFWHAESSHKSWPKSIPPQAIVIKGQKQQRRVVYGIESYFIPEREREKINKDLLINSESARAEVFIDAFGNAAIKRLKIQDRVYEY